MSLKESEEVAQKHGGTLSGRKTRAEPRKGTVAFTDSRSVIYDQKLNQTALKGNIYFQTGCIPCCLCNTVAQWTYHPSYLFICSVERIVGLRRFGK